MLDDRDFPLAQVGNLLFSPRYREAVITASTVPIARQLVAVLNAQARKERPEIPAQQTWLRIN